MLTAPCVEDRGSLVSFVPRVQFVADEHEFERSMAFLLALGGFCPRTSRAGSAARNLFPACSVASGSPGAVLSNVFAIRRARLATLLRRTPRTSIGPGWIGIQARVIRMRSDADGQAARKAKRELGLGQVPGKIAGCRLRCVVAPEGVIQNVLHHTAPLLLPTSSRQHAWGAALHTARAFARVADAW